MRFTVLFLASFQSGLPIYILEVCMKSIERAYRGACGILCSKQISSVSQNEVHPQSKNMGMGPYGIAQKGHITG